MKQPSIEYDIAVVGAGVVGAACAFRLAQGGRSVALLDRDEPGRACSFGNAGHLGTDHIFPLPSLSALMATPGYLLSKDAPLKIPARYALQIAPWLARFVWASRPSAFQRGTEALKSLLGRSMDDFLNLARDAGIVDLCRTDGHLMLVERAGSIREVKKLIADSTAHGVPVTWLEPDAAYELIGRRSPDIVGAAHFTGTGHVKSPFGIVQAFANAAVAAGADLQRSEIVSIERTSRGYTLKSHQGDIRAKSVLITAGVWSKSIVASLGFNVPLDTERGYHLMAEGGETSFRIPVSSFERKVIITPMVQGVRITGAIEFGGTKLPEDTNRYQILERTLDHLAPEVDRTRMSQWMGFRPSLPDLLPVIGCAPGEPNLLFAFGHQHLGLTLSGVTAEIVRCLAYNEATPIDLAPFRIERF